jgi:hypothetical protein
MHCTSQTLRGETLKKLHLSMLLKRHKNKIQCIKLQQYKITGVIIKLQPG